MICSRRHDGIRCLGRCWCLPMLVLLGWLLRLVFRACRPSPRRGDHDRHRVPSHVYRRPDPLIYDQYYLQSIGLAVTWDNPDIHLERADQPGMQVDSHALDPDTEYIVIARIWNGSNYAPAIDMPVRFSYLDFGIGTVSHPIGKTTVDLPARGAMGCPAFASVRWRTPEHAGHYCVQVELDWLDDANPQNNLGQHNTDVKQLNSPRAAFAFPVRNDGPRRQTLQLVADGYALPRREPCEERPKDDDRRAREERARRRHDPRRHCLPEGWELEVVPERLVLAPGEHVDVRVNVSAPEGFRGRQAINVNAFDHAVLTGGVTLYAEGDADG